MAGVWLRTTDGTDMQFFELWPGTSRVLWCCGLLPLLSAAGIGAHSEGEGMDSKPLRVSKNGKRMMVKSATGAFEWVDVPQPAADERVPAFLTPSPTTGQPVVAEPLGANGYRLITLVVLLAAFAALVYLALR